MNDTLIRGVNLATGYSLTPNDPRTIVALRSARTAQEYADITHLILQKRAKHRTWVTLQQRKWQTNVSRRPQRGNHHDSWDIRERYVRC